MENTTLYIAGKVSGLPDLNKPKFEAATRELRGRGFIVRNPHEICHGKKEEDWSGCMRECIKVLMECNVIVLLDDWLNSNGAKLEFSIAKSVGIQSIRYEELLEKLKPLEELK